MPSKPHARRGRQATVEHDEAAPPHDSQNEGPEARRHIVSVRFSEAEIGKIQAAGLLLEISPNELIRRACEAYLNHLVDSPEYEEGVARYRQRNEERIAALEGLRGAR